MPRQEISFTPRLLTTPVAAAYLGVSARDYARLFDALAAHRARRQG